MSVRHEAITIAKGSTFLTIGRIVSLVFDFLTSAILARFLGESSWGLWNLSISVYGFFFLIIIFFNISQSVIWHLSKYSLGQEKESERNIIVTSYKLKLIIHGVSSGFTIALAFQMADLFNQPILSSLLFIFAISHFFTALNSVEIFNAYKKFQYSAFLSIVGSVLKFLFTAFFLTRGYRVIGAAIAQGIFLTIISLLSFLIVVSRFLPKTLEKQHSDNKKITFVNTAKKLLTYGLPLSMSSLVGTFDYHMRNLALGSYVNLQALGHFRIATNISNLIKTPIGLVTTPLFPVVSRMYTKGETEKNKRLFQSLFKNMLLLVSIAIIFVELFAPEIISIVYSEVYLEASFYLRLLAPLTFFGVFSSMASIFFQSINETVIIFKINLVSAIVEIFSYFILIPILGSLGLILAIIVSTLFSCMILVTYFLNKYDMIDAFKFRYPHRIVISMSGLSILLAMIRPFVLHNALLIVALAPLVLMMSLVTSCITKTITKDEIETIRELLPSPIYRGLLFLENVF